MGDKFEIKNPIEIKDNSKERVAIDLMKFIGDEEIERPNRDRRYWLVLYRQCLKATYGSPLESILKEE